MATTVVGFFENYGAAESVVRELTAGGFRQEDVQIQSGEQSGGGGAQTGFGAKVSNFFNSIFGDDVSDEERSYYAEAVRRGNAVVTVRAEDEAADRVAEIMDRNGAIDIDERVASYQARGYAGFDPNAAPYTADEAARERDYYRSARAGDDAALPVVQEELRVGKRVVERGGVRIVRRVQERPVEETVNLREERVNVERRPVDRPVEGADLSPFREGTIEVTERAEELVVDKQARVVEEVIVNKEVTERPETVRDTVRRSDVEVEELNPEQRAKARRPGK